MESEFLLWAKTQGTTILLLSLALIFGYRKFTEHSKKQTQDLDKAWTAKENEADKRFEDLKERLNASDRRHEDCEKNRNQQAAQIFQLACMTGNVDALNPKPFKTEEEKI